MHHGLTRRSLTGLLASSALACALPVRAHSYPSRSLRMVLPVGTGGGGDTLGRVIAEQLSTQIRQPVIVENKPGADGLIAMQSLLSAPADGYTMLLIGPQPMVFNPLLRTNLPYTPTDLVPVIGVSRAWTVLVAAANSRFSTLADLQTAMRKEPEAVSLGTSGLSYQVGATLLGTKMGGRFRHVSYRSFPQILNDLNVGVLDLALVDTTPVVPLAAAGKLRVLASASKEREPVLADVPTVRESGIDFDFALWTALAVRAGTPGEIVRSLEAELRKTLTGNALRDFAQRLGTTRLSPVSGSEIDAEVASGLARFKDPVAEIAAQIGVEKR
ncbi:tripartite tricarboxylate transporter substrate binding protein [Xenophilus arseniciresistens]|uniref:Tripartite tricarboxylate transporter substrate binding protein n=1 Tax=Xenophilus arseniciresistens TaxID=1283306 RepID=A0AAE3SXV0_9BURK|nr:tripartite tricarboxylate transporter substrate binding protein [Xenophilus arseniciresistens]MDA7415324.1 tripartite tricarboxylate transporter substrate binding protein [Xenophilus arseniciresistens]